MLKFTIDIGKKRKEDFFNGFIVKKKTLELNVGFGDLWVTLEVKVQVVRSKI